MLRIETAKDAGSEILESRRDGEGFGEGKCDFYEGLHLHQGVGAGS